MEIEIRIVVGYGGVESGRIRRNYVFSVYSTMMAVFTLVDMFLIWAYAVVRTHGTIYKICAFLLV